jgi:hypothetical protein
MNLDQTFCSGLRCDRREACDRWVMHLKEYAHLIGVPISIAQFADHDGKCDDFIPRVQTFSNSKMEVL